MGVEDEESGEVTLFEAGHAYALRQSVTGRQDDVEKFAMEGLEWKQRRDALVNQFGSKKKKAAIRCAEFCTSRPWHRRCNVFSSFCFEF